MNDGGSFPFSLRSVLRNRAIVEVVVLSILCLLGNALDIPLLFGVQFIFGSFAVMLAAARLGAVYAVVVAAVGGAYTLHLWGHPYALVVFALEAMTVAILFKRGLKNLVLADLVYWLALGVPITFLLYSEALGMPAHEAWLVALKDMINGLFNALLAEIALLLPYLVRRKQVDIDAEPTQLRRMVFLGLLSAVLIANLLPTLYFTHQEKRDFQKSLLNIFTHETLVMEGFLNRNRNDSPQHWQKLLEQERLRFAAQSKTGIALFSPEHELIASAGPIHRNATRSDIIRLGKNHLSIWSPQNILNPMKRWEQSRYHFSTPLRDKRDSRVIGEFVIEQAALPFVTRQQEQVALQISFLAVVAIFSSLLAETLSRRLMRPMRLLARVARQTINGVIIADRTGHITWTNEGFHRISGYTLTELRGRKPGEILQGPDTDPATKMVLQDAVQTRQPVEVDLVNYKRDGSTYWVNIRCNPMFDEKGGFEGYIAIETDISERKSAEQQLLESEKIFRNANEAIVITDGDGTVLDVNDAFTRITGCHSQDVIGHTITQLLPLAETLNEEEAEIVNQLDKHNRWEGERPLRRGSGEEYTIWQTISVVRDQSGQVNRYVCLFNDITSLKRSEQALKRQAHYDGLTGLPNRLLLLDRLKQATARVQRSDRHLALAYIDLDGFKIVNDEHGHGTGDQLLKVIAKRMHGTLRDGDTLARIGGDEFVALIEDITDDADLENLLERIRLAVIPSEIINGAIVQVTLSLGAIVHKGPEFLDADLLLREADRSMYVAKRQGKNRIHITRSRHGPLVLGQDGI